MAYISSRTIVKTYANPEDVMCRYSASAHRAPDVAQIVRLRLESAYLNTMLVPLILEDWPQSLGYSPPNLSELTFSGGRQLGKSYLVLSEQVTEVFMR